MFQNLLKRVASSLTKAKIPYMVIGGQAVLIYGEPRATKDIDVTLGVGLEDFPEVMGVVKHLKLNPLVGSPESFAKKTMVLPVADKKTGLRVDFIFSYTPYEKQAIKKSKTIKFGRVKVHFAAMEDVVVHKIFAGRPLDMEDVKSILLKNPGFDRSYTLKMLAEFDKALGGGFVAKFRKILTELR